MVNRIDEDARRRLLAEAVWAIIRTRGFDAASVRSVASEAGLSAGSVRHFFGTQDELHVFAMEELARESAEEVRSVLDSGATGDAPPRGAEARALAVRGAAVLLPLDERRRELYAAQIQFTAKAAVHPPLRKTARAIADSIRAFCGHLVSSMVELGAADPDIDVPAARDRLCALVDGYTLELILDPDCLRPGEPLGELRSFFDSLATADERPPT